jgi:hypothetical protein
MELKNSYHLVNVQLKKRLEKIETAGKEEKRTPREFSERFSNTSCRL